VCVLLAVWIARKKIGMGWKRKVAGGFAVFLLALLLPFGDEIAGRVYFNHLCETEAGAKVYQTIELPAEYWDQDGKPTFYNGAMNNDVPSYAFKRLGIAVSLESRDRHRSFHIDQFGATIKDKKTDTVISEFTGFRYWGGWIARSFSPHNTAISCGGGTAYDELIEKQFKQQHLNSEK